MNWDDLKTFLAVADAGNLAGAAIRLRRNHSTVFRRLNALEEDLNARLFDRLSTGYVLTPVGERMLELARQIEMLTHGIEREVAGRDLAPSGSVRLTTAPNIARTIVPLIVRRLRQSHPGIVVETASGDTDYDLNRREADIALRATSQPPEHLIGRRLMELHWWVCASSSARGKLPRDPEDLAGHPLIGADNALMRLEVFHWLHARHRGQIVARANDLSTMASLARAGVGLAMLPSDQQESGLKRLFRLPDFGGELWLLTHPDLRNVQRIRAVWDAIVATVDELPPP